MQFVLTCITSDCTPSTLRMFYEDIVDPGTREATHYPAVSFAAT